MEMMMNVVPVKDELVERLYKANERDQRTGQNVEVQRKMYLLHANSLPETETDEIFMWEFSLFSGNRSGSADAHEIDKLLYRNWDKFEAGTHYLRLKVELRPHVRKTQDNRVMSLRSGFCIPRIMSGCEIVEATEAERYLINLSKAALDVTDYNPAVDAT